LRVERGELAVNSGSETLTIEWQEAQVLVTQSTANFLGNFICQICCGASCMPNGSPGPDNSRAR
jgi:hypothetical protein